MCKVGESLKHPSKLKGAGRGKGANENDLEETIRKILVNQNRASLSSESKQLCAEKRMPTFHLVPLAGHTGDAQKKCSGTAPSRSVLSFT